LKRRQEEKDMQTLAIKEELAALSQKWHYFRRKSLQKRNRVCNDNPLEAAAKTSSFA
jgi:hypothetical protein